MFLELAEGVDHRTWIHHLRQGDYSAWFRSPPAEAGGGPTHGGVVAAPCQKLHATLRTGLTSSSTVADSSTTRPMLIRPAARSDYSLCSVLSTSKKIALFVRRPIRQKAGGSP
jgi:hypothetical protein